MRKYSIIFVLLIIAVPGILTGCKNDSVESGGGLKERFIEITDIGVHTAATSIFIYDEDNGQHVRSKDGLISRIQTNDKTKYIMVKLSEAPARDKVVGAQVDLYGLPDSGKSTPYLEVIRFDGGKIWLFDAESETCYIMPWK